MKEYKMEETKSTGNFQNYDVFISHASADTKVGFVTFLYRGLLQAELWPFLDSRSLYVGEDCWERREHVIKNTPLAVVVFSECFTESEWCLRELHVMLHSPGVKVVPVFYDVRPSEVRFPESGQLKDGFKNLTTRQRDKTVIERFRADLEQASQIMGYEYPSGNFRSAHDFVKEVVGKILELANKPPPPLIVGDYVVGVKQLAEEIIQTLNEKEKVLMLGLWGVRGIGKSTLAREIYNRFNERFDSACYVEDVTEKVIEHGVVKVQNHIVKELCLDDSVEIEGKSKGKMILEERLCTKRIFMVLDDVRDSEEMEYWVTRKMLREGSLCIVTSRNRGLFERMSSFDIKNEVYIHDVQPLNIVDSKLLFTSFAFGGYFKVKPGFEELVTNISEACGGVPLLLKVCGALLKNNENVDMWEEVRKKLSSMKLPLDWAHRGAHNSLNGDSLVTEVVGKILEVVSEPLSLAVRNYTVNIKQVAVEITQIVKRMKEHSMHPGSSTIIRKQREITHDIAYVKEMQKSPSCVQRGASTKALVLPGAMFEQETQVPGNESVHGVVKRFDFHLKRAAECMEAVKQMSAREFNNEQCLYLADKLQEVLLCASMFLEAAQAGHHGLGLFEGMARYIEIFKLLVALANEIRSFIQSCCENGWIQAAMTLTNVSEHVSSIGFNLELCRVAWNKECAASGRLSLEEVVDIHEGEIEIVKKKASEDWKNLVAKVVCGLTEKSFSSGENDLAAFLLQRLLKVKPVQSSASAGSSWWSVLGELYKWVKPLGKIGKGSSGSVYRAMWLGTPVAKKTFPGQSNLEFKREAEILGGLCHSNITSMFCCAVDKNSCSIIMELMQEDLHDFMQGRCNSCIRVNNSGDESPPFTIFEAVDIMLQVGEGANYLHNQVTPSIVHRDLKSSNILVKCDSEIGYVHAKITDFGLSKTKDRSIRHSHLTPNMGTGKWMAPEVIEFYGLNQLRTEEMEHYPHKSDVYSFAIVCYEILTGHEPFPNESANAVKRKVLNGERPKLPAYCPLELKALIEECWNQEPKERPSFDAICSKLKYLKYLLMMGFSSNQDPLLGSLHA